MLNTSTAIPVTPNHSQAYSKITATYKNLDNEESYAEYIIIDTTEIDEESGLPIYNSENYQEYDAKAAEMENARLLREEENLSYSYILFSDQKMNAHIY